MDAKIISLQFALFFKDVVDRPDIEFKSINDKLMNIFDGVPTIFPIPKELPNDVPNVKLTSEKNKYVCNIARSRIDLIQKRVSGEKSNSEMLKDFNAKVNGFSRYVIDKQEISRFGVIARYFFEEKEAIDKIQSRYFKDLPDNMSELSLRYNANSKFENFKINDIIEISSSAVSTDNGVKEGILVHRDINNTPNRNRTLSYESLMAISEKYSPEILESRVEALVQ